MARVTYKNTLEDKAEFRDIQKETLLSCSYEYARTSSDELYSFVMKEKVSLQLNGEIIHPDDWLTLVSDEDEIVIFPILHGGDSGGFLQVAIGAALIIVAPYLAPEYIALTTVATVQVAGAAMALGGIASTLFKPNLPILSPGRGGETSQTYNWSGIKTMANTDSPIPIVYGTHKIGGNLISVFTEGVGEDNYLFMLIALCEGEISGICKYHDHDSICTTTDKSNADYRDPAIEIDDQPLKNFDEVEWWYRAGTNSEDGAKDQYDPTAQNLIPNFDGARIQYDDGRDLVVDGVVYTTTKAVDMVNIQVRAPSLLSSSGSSITSKNAEYRIEFKTEDEADYHDYEVNNYEPTVSASPGNASNCIVTYPIYDFLQRKYAPPTYTLRVLRNSFEEPSLGRLTVNYGIDIVITNTTTNISERRVIRQSVSAQQVYIAEGEGGDFYTNEICEVTHTYTEFTIDTYIIRMTQNVSEGDIFTISSTNTGSTIWFLLTGRTQTGVWTSQLIDFNNETSGSGLDTYMIRVSRRYEVSDEIQEQDNLTLHSVIEIVNGSFMYPNTALLAMKIKATGQLSGSIPNITTIIQGKKILVPSTTGGAETFSNVWYDATDERFENVDGAERAWDETTYVEQFNNNSILCIRDLITNKRYGLGLYLTTSDLYNSGVISAIKKCHIVYDPYDGVQPDFLSWYDTGQDNEWGNHWWFEQGRPETSDSAARTISLSDAAAYYTMAARLNSPLLKSGLYTFSVTLSNSTGIIDIIFTGATQEGQGFRLGRKNNCGDGTHTISSIVPPTASIQSIYFEFIRRSVAASYTITDLSVTGIGSDHYHTFDGVIESGQSALSVLLEMCESFRCWPVWFDGKFNFIIDEDTTPIHTISMGNMIEGSFSQSFTPLSEIPYILEGQLTDESIDYEMRTIAAKASNTDLVKINKRTIGLKGITNRQKAERELTFKLNRVINPTHVVNFKCGLDSIHATAGDLVYIQNNLPSWGRGGRILSFDSANASITMDATFPFSNANATYLIRYQTEDNTFLTATVLSSGTVQSINVNSWPSSDPVENAVYAVGHVNSYSKPFRLISVSREEDDEIEAVAIEHISSIYSEPTITIFEDNYSTLPNQLGQPSMPSNVSVCALNIIEGIGFVVRAEPALNNYNIKDIVVEMSDADNWQFDIIGIIPAGQNQIKYRNNSLVLDNTYRFKIYSRSIYKEGTPVYINCFLPRVNYRPAPPTGIRIRNEDPLSQTWDGKDLIVEWDTPSVNPYLEARIGRYKVEVYHGSTARNNLLRTVFTSTTSFTYYFDWNIASSAGIPYDDLIIVLYTICTDGTISAGSIPFVTQNIDPDPPTTLSATAGINNVLVQWTNPTVEDFRATLIYRNTTGVTPDSSDLYYTSQGRSGLTAVFLDSDVSYGTTYYYWFKSQDMFYNVSSLTTSVNAAPNQVVGADVSTSTTITSGSAEDVAVLSGDNATWRIWAGTSDPTTAPFRVDRNGNLVTTSATISGAISASTIDIGGADATSFHVDVDGNLWSGAAAFGDGTFSVSSTGDIIAMSAYIRDYADTKTIELELMKMNFQQISWAQFAVFDAFEDETKRASPDPSTYDARVYQGYLDNGDDTTADRAFGFVSKTYTDITTVETGTSTSVGLNFLADTSKNWFTDEAKNLTLKDSASSTFTVTSNTSNTLTIAGTPAAGAYSLIDSNPGYTVAFCSFLDSTNGGTGYTKLEVSFNGGTNYQTFLDTENTIDLLEGTVAIDYPGNDYIARITLKNDGAGDGSVVYKFLVCTDPSCWRF